jgi:hypothetical protein
MTLQVEHVTACVAGRILLGGCIVFIHNPSGIAVHLSCTTGMILRRRYTCVSFLSSS